MGRILVEPGEKMAIAKLMKVSRQTVYLALTGASRSGLAREIRSLAKKRGGVEVQENTTNNN